MKESGPLKRLFVGWECKVSAYKPFPPGRRISPPHMTIAFLGNISPDALMSNLHSFPSYDSHLSTCAIGDILDFLPPKHPRVAALHVEGLLPEFFLFQKKLTDWLSALGYTMDPRPFYPHVSLVRAPLDQNKWEKWPTPSPVLFQSIHLYESMGSCIYKPIWTYPLLSPFDEIEHTADLAFCIRGRTIEELHYHAQMALAFEFPPLIEFIKQQAPADLTSMVILLNELISMTDREVGCPFKAVSFHGEIVKMENGLLQWEMIIDV